MRKVEATINNKPVTVLILDDCHVSTERVLEEIRFACLVGVFEEGEEDND